MREQTVRAAQDRSLPLHLWRHFYLQHDEEAIRAAEVGRERAVPMGRGLYGLMLANPDGTVLMPSANPVQCYAHYGTFCRGCYICQLASEASLNLNLKRSLQSQPPLPKASPRTSLNVEPSESGTVSLWCTNHHRIPNPTCPRCIAKGSAKLDLAKRRIGQAHSPLPPADLSEPLAATAMPIPNCSSPFHAMLVEKVESWLDRSRPLYLMPTRDPNMFAYYLALMEWGWNNNLEQSRIDGMTRAILARVDGVAFQAWLISPSGVPELKENECDERRGSLDLMLDLWPERTSAPLYQY